MREHFCSMLRCNFNLYQTITLHEDTKALALISHIFTCCSCCTCRCRFCVTFTCNFNLLHRLLLASLLLSTLNRSVFISLLIAGVCSCPFNFTFTFYVIQKNIPKCFLPTSDVCTVRMFFEFHFHFLFQIAPTFKSIFTPTLCRRLPSIGCGVRQSTKLEGKW